MLFNIDRRTKEAIRNMYKQEAELSEKRKKDEKCKKLEEEREYIKRALDREEEQRKREYSERMKKNDQTMGEYNRIVREKEQGRDARYNGNDESRRLNAWENFNNVQTRENYSPRSNSSDYVNTERSYKIEQQRLYKNYLDSQV
jgi:hypothetical protein